MKTWMMIWGAALIALPGTAQEMRTVDSRVVSATVFQNRALVTREGTISLPAGTHALVFGGLTPELLDESVRVTGEGTMPVRIVDVRIETAFTAEILQARRKSLEEKLDGLIFEQQAVKDRISVRETEKAFIESLRAESPKEINKTLLSAAPNTQNWQSMLTFFNKNLTEIYGQIRTLRAEHAELQKRIDALQKELDGLSPAAADRFKNIVVTVDLKAPARVTLHPSYMVGRHASWMPVYDLRVEPETRRMDMTSYGLVRQNTGEDWNDIRLTLSTAQPMISQTIPYLSPWHVDFIRTETARSGVLMKREMTTLAVEAPAAPAADAFEAAPVTAQAETRGTATIFTLGGRNTVPADNAPHKATIALVTLEGEFEYVSVPKLADKVFLRGAAANSSDAPFLPGEVGIFVEGDFVSKTRIPYIAQNDTLSLALGVDENIRVERKLINRFVEKKGLFGGRRKITFTFETRIENHRNTAETVRVIDQLPLSRDEKIRVRLLDPPEDEVRIDSQNRVEWRVPLNPGEKKTLPFRFEVEYPEGTDINL
ncbi:MAG TPA: mucoidy inhibitor MuiA family protein [bacterium]|nr:mucoidy inhibitor MuiA family protein [bacterium]